MFSNAIKQTTTTTGTGNLTLSAVSNYAELNDDPVYAAGGRFTYMLLDSNGIALETGLGYLSSSTVMVREKVLWTLVSGTVDNISPSAVSLTGTTTVICTLSSEMVTQASVGPNRNSSLNLQKVVFSTHLSFGQSNSAGVTLVANRLFMVPMRLEARVECDALCLRVGTGAASSNVRLGLWDIQADGHPGKLLGETGALASATNSTDVIGTLGTTITLNPGWYYTGVVSDGTPAVGRASLNGETYAFLGPSSGNLMQGNAAFYSSHTFGALPNPAASASLTVVNANAAYPAVGLRCV